MAHGSAVGRRVCPAGFKSVELTQPAAELVQQSAYSNLARSDPAGYIVSGASQLYNWPGWINSGP